MNRFFYTDWDRLTGFDWAGLIMVVVIASLMFGVYFWVWRPGNKNKFEQHRDFVLKDNLFNNAKVEYVKRENATHGHK